MSRADRDKWNERYRAGAYAQRTWPNELLERWIDRLPRGRALDVACGAGRNALFLAARGYEVDAVDISAEALRRAAESADEAGVNVNWIEHDLDEPLPLDGDYELIVVARYVNRGLMPRLTALLAPGGVLVCEEHLVSDTPVAGPSSPRFRLQPGELRALTAGLCTLHEFEGITEDPGGNSVALARIVAQRQEEN